METIHEATRAFLFHCTYEKKLSKKTLEAYAIDCAQFVCFIQKRRKASILIKTIDKLVLKKFLHHLKNSKPKTLKRKVATLKAMFNFLEFEDEILINPFRKIKIKIREPFILPSVMSLEEVQKILVVAMQQLKNTSNSNSFKHLERLRHLAVLELLFATGIRVSELCFLKPLDVDLVTGSLKIMGKGSRERIIQLCHPDVLQTLFLYNSKIKRKAKRKEYFFINRFGNRLSDQSVRNMIKHYSIQAKIKKKITPHTFRHSFATLLLEQDVDIKYIQSLLGHSSITTTQIYTHVNSSKQREILSSHHPRKLIQRE